MDRRLAAKVALSSALAGAALALAPASPASAAPTCHGRRATVVGLGHGIHDGTAHRDVVVTSGATMIGAEGGDDLICNDALDGGDGIDSADGGPGTDTCNAEVRTACELPAPRSGHALG